MIEVGDSNPGDGEPEPDQCEENLRHLYSKEVYIDFEFISLDHVYTIDFGAFSLLEGCY